MGSPKIVQKGELDGSVLGVWKVTDAGRRRIGGSLAVPKTFALRYDTKRVHRVAEGEVGHDILKKRNREIGEVLGTYSKEEYAARPYIYDVIRKDLEDLRVPASLRGARQGRG